MAGVIIDRFGKDIPMIPVDDDHFEARVDMADMQNVTLLCKKSYENYVTDRFGSDMEKPSEKPCG